MPINTRAALLAAAAVLAVSGCNAGGTVPSSAPGANSPSAVSSQADRAESPADTTSILKLLTKDVLIGSTVDPTNGDTGPRAISIAPGSSGKMKKGDLLVCNFDDASGTVGNGTTIELLPNAPSSSPSTFVQSSKIEGCDGDAIASDDEVYATGLTSKLMVLLSPTGAVKKSYGSPLTDPLGNGAAPPPPQSSYASEYIFVGNADTGAIDSISIGQYGTKKLLEVVKGFGVKGSGWRALGPSAFVYQSKKKAQVLYVADGACNAVVAIQNPDSLLEKDEITVQPGCKSFTCLHPKVTCATLVKAGPPLKSPVAETLLPNGNLIVANTKDGNTLVEMTPTGQVLDTKVVDTSKTAAVFGLMATGTSDSNTALYYTDANSNTLQELEQP